MIVFAIFGSVFGIVFGMQWLYCVATEETGVNQRVFGVAALLCFLAVTIVFLSYVAGALPG